jgi:hypothetical protein
LLLTFFPFCADRHQINEWRQPVHLSPVRLDHSRREKAHWSTPRPGSGKWERQIFLYLIKSSGRCFFFLAIHFSSRSPFVYKFGSQLAPQIFRPFTQWPFLTQWPLIRDRILFLDIKMCIMFKACILDFLKMQHMFP